MATQTLNVIFDGSTDVPRLPGQSAVEWFDNRIGYYSVYYEAPNPGDDLDATARLTGGDWRMGNLRIAGDDHVTRVLDLDAGERRIDYLELGYNSEVEFISTRARFIYGWDGDKHEIKLGNQQNGSTESIILYADKNIVTTGNENVLLLRTTGTKGDVHKIGSGGAGTVRTDDGNDKVTTTSGWVELISTGDGKDKVYLGKAGAGVIRTGDGNDLVVVSELEPQNGTIISAGGGTDTLDFKKFKSGVTFDLSNSGWQNVAATAKNPDDPAKGYFAASSFENLKGTRKNDTLTGDNKDNVIVGRGGKDTIEGAGGNDTLVGSGGNDTFVFGANAGTDRVKGFKDGGDIIAIEDHQGGFRSLDISKAGKNLEIVHDGGTIILVGEAGETNLTKADFDFI